MSFTLEPTEAPEEAKVTPVLSKDLADLPGEEGLMLTVQYPPGASDPTIEGTFIEGLTSCQSHFLSALTNDKGAPVLVPAN